MSNDNDKTTSGSVAENTAPAAQSKRKVSLAFKPDSIAGKNLVIKDKNLYREQLEMLKKENRDTFDTQASESDAGQPDSAASDTAENNEQLDAATIGEDCIEAAPGTEVETSADSEAEDTEQHESETVIGTEYFADAEDAEQDQPEDADESIPQLAAENTIEAEQPEPPEDQIAEKTPESDDSREPEDISDKESEPAEAVPAETNALLSSLINNLKALPAKDAEKDTAEEKDSNAENIPHQDGQGADDGAVKTDAPQAEAETKAVEAVADAPCAEIPHDEAVATTQQAEAAPAPPQYNVPAGQPGHGALPQYNVPVANNLSNSVPYQYNVPVAPSPPLYTAKPPVPSRRNEKSFAYVLFVVLLAAMTLVTAFTYLLWSPGGSEGVTPDTDEPDTEQTDVLEVFKWEENGLLYLSINETVLIVVNRDNKLPSDYGDGVDPDAKAAYDNMLQAAENEGVNIYTAADYLDYESQDLRYNRYANYHGEDIVDMFMQKAGYSENQLGVAFHVNCSEADYMYSETFAQTPEYQWLAQNAADYGFILRYPEGKESLTGYSFSPWHFRYVGEDLARLMAQSGMVIEEYLDIAQPLPEAV